jgi:pilus assembly protein Flp/PilA
MLKAYLTVKNALNRDEEGQGLVEYGLIIALVGILLAASLTALQGQLDTTFDTIVTKLGGGAAVVVEE